MQSKVLLHEVGQFHFQQSAKLEFWAKLKQNITNQFLNLYLFQIYKVLYVYKCKAAVPLHLFAVWPC